MDLYGNKTRKPTAKPHTSWAKWQRKYPTLDAWIEAHPGQPAGRQISKPCDVNYYRLTIACETHFDYCRRKRDIPKAKPGSQDGAMFCYAIDVKIYKTFKAWQQDRLKFIF
jgi:hypothetical protein